MPYGGRMIGLAGLWLLGMASCGQPLGAADEPQPASAPQAAEAKPTAAEQADRIEKLTQQTRQSVVVVTVTGRDGRQQSLGSGFIVSPDGLIATNLHVIGEARPVSVKTFGGKSYEVTAIEAFDRAADLAVIRIDAKELPAIPLGDSDKLVQGQGVLALGNPQGLAHSVVTGVVSGVREIEGRNMIQLAIPIEQGNSGGPLLDHAGRVQGILTMKSAVTENLGFAMPVNTLKPLIERPNPTIMARWLTIGAIDPREWRPLFGARWRQRAGRILVDGLGQGFGGRSICLAETQVPEAPYEIAVSVKLDREEGAAGLVFCSNGEHVHYGFYPSNGKMRLTRFEGADVFSWKVLAEIRSEHYRPGDWNLLKVRFEKGKITCFVNDQAAIESTDAGLLEGKVGLAKFRDTGAEFRNFRLAPELPVERASAGTVDRIGRIADEMRQDRPIANEVAEALAGSPEVDIGAIRDIARQFDLKAAGLRTLAQSVHQKRVLAELHKALAAEEPAVDLFHAALLVAQLDNDEVDVASYRKELDRMARDIAQTLPADATEGARLAALNKFLFEEQGFHGSRGDYYHRSNSYVNEVLDDREGLPISLAVIYIELAGKLGLKVVGVGLPGHFVVRHEPAAGETQLIDVYAGGKALARNDADTLVRESTGRPAREADFASPTKRAIIVRMLHNLLGLAQRGRDAQEMLRYLDAILTIVPESAEERFMRAVLHYQSGRRDQAMRDADWLLDKRPAGIDLNQVDEFRRILDRPN
jgi:serine protease Do